MKKCAFRSTSARWEFALILHRESSRSGTGSLNEEWTVWPLISRVAAIPEKEVEMKGIFLICRFFKIVLYKNVFPVPADVK